MNNRSALCAFICAVFFLTGCSESAPFARYLHTADIAAKHHFKKELFESNSFSIMVYSRIDSPGDDINIYIEGDGLAWINRNRVSTDPTPRNPVALKLATTDSAMNVVYIARPCQYVLATGNGRNCEKSDWTSGRFSERVVESVNEVLSAIKNESRSSGINLIGYSGGGAIAVLVAARRNDIKSLRTLAGNLDHDQFCRFHNVSAMHESLNAIDKAKAIAQIPQIHFVGAEDKTVPREIAENFVKAQGPGACAEVVSVKDVSHGKGWETTWDRLLKKTPSCH